MRTTAHIEKLLLPCNKVEIASVRTLSPEVWERVKLLKRATPSGRRPSMWSGMHPTRSTRQRISTAKEYGHTSRQIQNCTIVGKSTTWIQAPRRTNAPTVANWVRYGSKGSRTSLNHWKSRPYKWNIISLYARKVATSTSSANLTTCNSRNVNMYFYLTAN